MVSGMALLDSDISTLLSWSRPMELEMPAAPFNFDGNAEDLLDEFSLVPQLVFALLLSLVPQVEKLGRMLRQDWVRAWKGWVQYLENCGDGTAAEGAALECIQDFARISLQNVAVVGKSDAARRAEIQQQSKRIGQGLVHDRNDCCTDSLLQLLAAAGFVDASLRQDVVARRAACHACRQHLQQHSEPRLRPCVRKANGTVAHATDLEHERAFLQHDVHGEAIVYFAAGLWPGSHPLPAQGLLIRAYTRSDTPLVVASAFIACRSYLFSGVSVETVPPAFELELYNNTGGSYTGYHYDPIFSDRVFRQDRNAAAAPAGSLKPASHAASPNPAMGCSSSDCGKPLAFPCEMAHACHAHVVWDEFQLEMRTRRASSSVGLLPPPLPHEAGRPTKRLRFRADQI